MSLTGKTAVVTGGAKGIGRAVCKLFAERGANVVIADCDAEEGKKAETEIRNSGGKIRFIRCDVSREQDVNTALDTACREFGSLDIVVNDAALQWNKPLLETTLEDFEQVMRVNLTGTFLFLREAAKIMIRQGRGGSIINFSSTFALVGSPGYLAYHASKGAITSMTRAAAVSLMPHGIRVNSVAPGTTETPGLHDGAEGTGDHEKGMRSFLALQPLKRFGKAEEIAKVVAFLADGEESSFLFGSNVVADGGYTIV